MELWIEKERERERKNQKRGKRGKEVTKRAIENYTKYVCMNVCESVC